MTVLSRGANLFAYQSSSATRVIYLCIVARIEWLGENESKRKLFMKNIFGNANLALKYFEKIS
jgi:hypothetical protein